MLPTHYNTPRLWKYVHDLLSPIKWLWWRIVETMFRVQFGLKGDLLPKSRIELDLGGRAASRPCEGSQPSVRGAGLLVGRELIGSDSRP